eukprot:gene17442-19186_t
MSMEAILPVASLQFHEKFNKLSGGSIQSLISPNKSAKILEEYWREPVPDVENNTSTTKSGNGTTATSNSKSRQQNGEIISSEQGHTKVNKVKSFGGSNNSYSSSKVVLRRWTSVVSQEDKLKRNSSFAYEGDEKRKVFRPVSSILLSTPWEKDFVGKSKGKGVEENQIRDIRTENNRGRAGVQITNPRQSCLLNERVQDFQRISPRGLEKAGLTGKKSEITGEKLDIIENHQINIDTNEKNDILSKDYSQLDHPQKVVRNSSIEGENTFSILNNNSNNEDNSEIHHTTSTANGEVIKETLDKSEDNTKDMPLTSSYPHYSRKYDAGMDMSSSKRRNYYPSSVPSSSYASSPRAGTKIKELDQKVKDSVQEVDAYILAYKSRRERSFEHGENSIYSNLSSSSNRTDRKSSIDRGVRETSHASRNYASSYSSQDTGITNGHEPARQRSYYSRTTDKDYGYSSHNRAINYPTTTSRFEKTKSFDTELSSAQSLLTRTTSGSRYARQPITSSSETSSKSTSRKISPSDGLIRNNRSSSYVPPSRGEDQIGSTEVTDRVTRNPDRRSKQLVHQHSLPNPPESSSRSRIMGGILSRFFNNEEDSTTSVVATSPSMTSEYRNGSRSTTSQVSQKRQLVRVKSSFVGTHDADVFNEKQEVTETAETGKSMGAKYSKDREGLKSNEIPTQQKERRSSWIGRSLRRISSSSSKASPAPTTTEADENDEKPKRERRRSLLWRLGKESKTTDPDQSENANTKQTSSIDIADSSQNKSNKVEEKTQQSELNNKPKEKEKSGLLGRRSSKRRKDQSPEKEIVEARQETAEETHEKNDVDGKVSDSKRAELAQLNLSLDSDVKTVSPVDEKSYVIIDSPTVAPLAQVEHSDSEEENPHDDDSNMSQVNSGAGSSSQSEKVSTRFADVLRRKEQAKLDTPAKTESKSSSSYLSARFMKSKHIFENKLDRPSTDTTASNEYKKSNVDAKRRAFNRQAPRSKTLDIVTPTKLASFQSRGDNTRFVNKRFDADAVADTSSDKDKEKRRETSSQSSGMGQTKGAFRRLTIDSVASASTPKRTEKDGRSESELDAKKSDMRLNGHVVRSQEQTGERRHKNVVNDEKDFVSERRELEAVKEVKPKQESSATEQEMSGIREEVGEIKGGASGANKASKSERGINEKVSSLRVSSVDLNKKAIHEKLSVANEAEAKQNEAEAKQNEAEAKQNETEAKQSEAEAKQNETEAKQNEAERVGSRRRRDRRTYRAKAINPSDIEQVKEQMRSDSTAKDVDGDIVKDIAIKKKVGETEDKSRNEELKENIIEDVKVEKPHEKVGEVDNTKKQVIPIVIEPAAVSDKEDGKLNEFDKKDNKPTVAKLENRIVNDVAKNVDDEESSGSSSGHKLTTRSVIKEKIRQKKHTKHRAARAMSLPLGVSVVITPPSATDGHKTGGTVKDKLSNGPEPTVLTSRPPIVPAKPRSREADDISSLKKARRPARSRPKTLTQGIDPGLLLSDIRSKEEAVIIEEKLSIVQIKQRLMQAEAGSGSRTPKTSETQRKNKRRSGKRYKTITEGIAPGILEKAHQYASNNEENSQFLGVDHMNRLNIALTASTENVKRRSFIVSEVNSKVGSKTTSLATSMEDLSLKNDEDEKSADSVVALSIKKLKKLPMAQDSDDDEEAMPSVSSLKQRFLLAVEDSYNAPKNKVTLRPKRGAKDRPFTISGIDDITLRKIQSDIKERHDVEYANDAQAKINKVEDTEKEEKKIDILSEDEIESILKAEGLTAEQLAVKLGINPSLSRGSPARTRKPFLSSTTEEPMSNGLEMIEEKPEKYHHQQAEPLGDLRKQFLSAMTDFKTGTAGDEDELQEEEKAAQKRVGVIVNVDKIDEEPDDHHDDSQQSDLDLISQSTTQLKHITDRRHLKPQRRQRSSANPLKSLQARDDLITEVGNEHKAIEDAKPEPTVGKGLNALSQKSLGQKLWRKVALANEAKAALQGTEDFSKVKLRKVKEPGKLSSEGDETGGVKQSSVSNLLLKIKGRRHVQVNLVDFSTSSLNNGDSFVLVTPKELFCWHGRFANVIEKAKAAEIASRINQKKEMGCKAFDVIYFEQGGQNESRVFRTLGSTDRVDIQDDDIDDEDFEKNMMSTYMVYRLQDSEPPELVPVYEMCHRSPSKDMLKTDEAFVFDFMSEVYVWIGRQTISSLRKKILTLAREKFDQGYFKPQTQTSTPHHHGKARKISLTATELPTRKQSLHRKMSVHKFLFEKENLAPRPEPSIFLSMYEQAEWVIFKEKFCDWPDESRIIRMRGGPQTRGEIVKKVEVVDIKEVDPTTMMEIKVDPKLPVFEGTEIERGQGRPKGPDGYHIITREVNTWHVTERSRTLLPEASHGHFHSGEGYVIRWEYSIVASRVMKMLKDIDEAKATGRHKCAYFFWLGNDCSITEQGATAVMTVDLDEERGPQLRVVQGKEPPCFLNLFDGGMIVHAGKRQTQATKSNYSDRSAVRFYCVRNEIPTEACLLQVPVTANSLRSRSSFILVLCKQAEIFLWHGCKSSEATRETASHAAHRLIENHPEEAALSEKTEIFLTEVEEGQEPEVFWVALGGEEDYGSFLSDVNCQWDFVPRCFHMTSETGLFIASEITNPFISPKEKCPFPFLQDDLYDAYQPAIFIIDATHEVYLWLGWWPDEEEVENSDAQRLRWDMLKKKAMESVILYAKEAGRSLSHCYMVDAGLEPDQFINLFPYWIVQEDITDIQLEDGREDSDRLQLITEKLEGFKREFYSIEELLQRPLPEGVNPALLETYLSHEDFEHIFRLSREDFKKLPNWKQVNLKKKSGLY